MSVKVIETTDRKNISKLVNFVLTGYWWHHCYLSEGYSLLYRETVRFGYYRKTKGHNNFENN